MRKILMTLCLSVIINCAFSQLLFVPDDSFEAFLESIGGGAFFSNGVPNDNYINSSNVASQEGLVIQGNIYPITDFTGLEAFTSLNLIMLSNFFCNTINISMINSSSIEIDVNNCPGLVNLYLPVKVSLLDIEFNNSFKNLYFLPNTEFVYGPSNWIYIRYNNSLEILDFSNVSNLTSMNLIVENNPILKCLNLHNGYCYTYNLVSTQDGNNMLTCVEVDDPVYSINASTWFESIQNIYSTNCSNCTLSTELLKLKIHFSPNPTSSEITITSDKFTNETYTIYDQMGRTVGSGILAGTSTTISLNTLSKGIYILKVEGAYESAIVVKE